MFQKQIRDFLAYQQDELLDCSHGIFEQIFRRTQIYRCGSEIKGIRLSNAHTKEISDLTISRDDEENIVTEVKLMFDDSFDEDTKYPSNL